MRCEAVLARTGAACLPGGMDTDARSVSRLARQTSSTPITIAAPTTTASQLGQVAGPAAITAARPPNSSTLASENSRADRRNGSFIAAVGVMTAGRLLKCTRQPALTRNAIA
jgi:hypothetical protein